MKLIGILLAAGRGRRFGGNKQFHPVPTPSGEKPLVVAACETIAPVCDKMLIVLGHRAPEVATVIKGSGVFSTQKNTPDPFILADPDAPMFHSIQAGITAAVAAEPNARILMQLGDHPLLERATLELLLVTAAKHPDKAVMPTYQGRGGHPVIIPARIAEKVLAAKGSGSLRQFWSENPDLCQRVEVGDPGVIHDIDSL